MLRIVDCITVEHNLSILLLAVGICIAGAVASVVVAGRARVAGQQAKWVGLLGFSVGATAWTTHFVSMLGYQTNLPITYDPLLTATSFLSGIVLISLGCFIARNGRANCLFRSVGGAIVGSGVIALHYIGIAGLHLPGTLTYLPAYVVASVVLSLGLGAAAMNVVFGPQRVHTAMSGVVLLVAMIATLHFTGMASIELQLEHFDDRLGRGVSRFAIVLAVAASTLSILAIGTTGAVVDRLLSNRLAAEAERFKTLSDGAFEGLIIHHNGVVLDANTAARKLLGLQEPLDQYPLIEGIEDLKIPLGDSTELISEVEINGAGNNPFPAEICRRRIQLSNKRSGELLAIRDLTARKKSEARIEHLALHDPLTDLPNRRLFGQLAGSTLDEAAHTGGSFAVLAIDLDNFKIINDVYGHVVGDQLIKKVAARLKALVKSGDVVARPGGDEFLLLETDARLPEAAAVLAERIIGELKSPVRLEVGGRLFTLNINTSIGIAVYPFDGGTVDELLRFADTAMYVAKDGGKATYRFFEKSMNKVSEHRHRIEEGLRQALAESTFELAYQPIVSANTREPVCFEALLRWTHKELGPVSPDNFIPVAESSGLIKPIGELVLRQACREAMKWPASIRVGVNLSAVQFKGNELIGAVQAALDESGLPGERLELEVTESLLIDNRDEALRQLKALKAQGIRIAMDDFGTGYSSLSYLQSFGFDKLKIDKSFISDLGSEPQCASIARAVVSMGQSLSMQVVAEGVETEAQAAELVSMSCDLLQGYLIAKPMPPDSINDFLHTHEQDAEVSALSSGNTV